MCDKTKEMQMLGEAFDKFDVDKSGFLDKDEILKVVNIAATQFDGKLTAAQLDEEVKEFFAAIDKNNDGKITKKEFLDYYSKFV